MKKSLIIAALLVAGVASAFAVEYTAKAKITLGSNALTLREAAQFSDAFDNGYDASQFNSTGIVVKAVISGETTTEWAQWATNDLEGVVVAFKVAVAGEQTLTFSNVQGTPLYLVDAIANKTTEITEGGSYVFTADAADVSAWNTTRFSITKVAPLADYTFIGGIVTIGELKDGTKICIQYFKYVDGKRVNGIYGFNPTKSFKPYTTEGYCEISYTNKAGVERKFIVNPAPVVTPANN